MRNVIAFHFYFPALQGPETLVFAAFLIGAKHTINMLHPFREGNGRVQRAFFEYWAEERLGCQLNLAAIDPDEFMVATIYAAQGIMDQLINCFESMLQPLEMTMDMEMKMF